MGCTKEHVKGIDMSLALLTASEENGQIPG